ncbi:MAG: hypothetical protein ACREMP_03235 [Candidatus Tyrphobacter sp.]
MRYVPSLVALVLALPLLAATPHPRVPAFHFPSVPLRTTFLVEVNHKGQVVRVTSAHGCRYQFFNVQTYGNVLQMWIRHPDGSADVGLYRVSYFYNPRTRTISRHVAIVKRGGRWANSQGAADAMLDIARRAQQEQSGANLPPLDRIIGPTPSPRPRHS